MRSRALVAAALLGVLAAARAHAVERVEQGAAGVATAGAQTADADTPAAVYYNVAALAFQPGLTISAGADVVLRHGTATTSTGAAHDDTVTASPAVFVGQRIGNKFAVGVGVYEPYASASQYPSDWAGAAFGTSLTLHAYDINPSLAIRPHPRVAFGFGIDIVPTAFDYVAGIEVHTHTTGVGGNAGLLVRVVPRWLDAAFSYRSAIDVDVPAFGSHATLSLPHAFTWALASHPVRGLTVDVEVRYVIWQDLKSLLWKQPDGTSSGLVVNWQNTVGVRAGVSYRFFRDHLVARVGGGWEQSPSTAATTPPVLALGDRGLVGAGVGGAWRWLAVDAGYLATLATEFTGASANGFVARYASLSHTVSVALTLRLPEWPWRARLTDPAYH